MPRLRLPTLAAPLALAAALAVGLAAAAQNPAPAPAPGWRDHGGMRDPAAMREAMQRHRAQTVADWTTVLKLTPPQAQALSAVMQRPEHRSEGKGRRGPDAAPEGTMQRLDDMQARMAEREARATAHLAAMKSFYASLSPDQQRTFDAVTRLSHGGMHGRHRGGPGFGEGMGAPGPMGHRPPPPPAGANPQ